MIGETRADSRVLNLAAAASEMSASKGAPQLTDSDFLAREMDSSANDKVKLKSLKERAAAIAAGISNSGKNKTSKGKVTKDAGNRSNSVTSSQVSRLSRVTRRQAAQNGGAHAASSGEGSEDNPAGSSTSESTPELGDSSQGKKPTSPSVEGDVVGHILELQEETHGGSSKEPPAKKARDKSAASGSHAALDSPPGGFNISLELLGAIKNLNNSLTSTLMTNVSGMRDDFKGLASSMSDNFQKLTSKLSHNNNNNNRDSSDEESSRKSSGSEEDPEDYSDSGRSKIQDHPMSEGESEGDRSTNKLRPPSLGGSGKNPPKPGEKEKTPADPPSLTSPEGTPGNQGDTAEKKSFFAKKRALMTPTKDTGDPLDEDLSMILADKFWGQNVIAKEDFLDIMKSTLRPENTVVLSVPAIQEVLWTDLPEGVRGRDKWERLTQANLMVIWRQLAYIARFLDKWEVITSDRNILNLIKGVRLEFSDLPRQDSRPREYKFNRESSNILDKEVASLIERGIVSDHNKSQTDYVSNIFLRPKPGGKHRMILDLSSLNDNIIKKHFKMSHLDTAIALLSKDCFMGSIDLKCFLLSPNPSRV